MPAPGVAKTNKFVLSTATVMIGQMTDLHNLNPVEHSIGLVKNFQLTHDPAYVELGQGITNQIVASVKNQDTLNCSMEVYEFTTRNIAYAAGLDASGIAFDPISTTYPVSAASTTTTVKTATDVSALILPGDFIFVQKGTEDVVHIAKVLTSVFSTGVTTITFATGYSIPVSVTFGVGDRIGKVTKVSVGGDTFQPTLAAKVVGILPQDGAPFTVLFPKIKITKGLGVSFQSDNFSNLPFEFTPYAGVPGDAFYSEYSTASLALFPR